MTDIASQITGNEDFWGPLKGLISSDAISIINKSPTLVGELLTYNSAVAKGDGKITPISINLNDPNVLQFTGSNLDFGQNILTWSPEKLVGNLSHEIGHFVNQANDQAFYDGLRTNPNDPSAAAQYAVVGARAEGEAVLNNYIVQQEIHSNGGKNDGPLIVLNGNGDSKGLLQQTLDRQHASDIAAGKTQAQDNAALIQAAGSIFSSLHPSGTPEGTTYAEYFVKSIPIEFGGASGSASSKGAISSVTLTSTDGSGNISSATIQFSSGESSTLTFTNQALTLAVLSGPTGSIVSRTTYAKNNDGTVTGAVYDPAGHLTDATVYHTDGSYVTTTYDGNAKVASLTSFDSGGHVVGSATNSYNPDGSYSTTVTDASGKKDSVTTFDRSNRRVSETFYKPDGSIADSVTYAYDAAGALKTTTQLNAVGKITSITTYDANQQVATVQSFAYDANGTLVSTSTVDANGVPVIAPPPPSTTPTGVADPIHTAVTARDGAGRPTQVTYYNAAGNNIGGDSVVYDGAGRVVGFTLSSADYSAQTGYSQPAVTDGSWMEVLRNIDGSISRIIPHLPNGTTGTNINLVYHDNGSRTLSFVSPSGTPIMSSNFDPSGHFTSTQIAGSQAHVDYTRLGDGGYSLTKFGDNGKQIQTDHFGADGKEIDQTIINYNTDGSVSGKTILTFAKDANGYRSSTTYNNGGQIVETARVGDGNVKVAIDTYVYNPDGSRDVTHTDSMGNILSREHFASDGTAQDRLDQFNDAQGRLHVKITHADGKYFETVHANGRSDSSIVEQSWLDQKNQLHVRTPLAGRPGGFSETFQDSRLGPVQLLQPGPGQSVIIVTATGRTALSASAAAIGFDFDSIDPSKLNHGFNGGVLLPGTGVVGVIPGQQDSHGPTVTILPAIPEGDAPPINYVPPFSSGPSDFKQVTPMSAYQTPVQRANLAAGDGKALSSVDVEKLVQAMAAFAPSAPGTMSLTADPQRAPQPMLATFVASVSLRVPLGYVA
jgi:hypothetical protein